MNAKRSNSQRKGKGKARPNKSKKVVSESAPAAKGFRMLGSAPSIRGHSGGVVVSHREFVSDIYGDPTFFRVQKTIPINPGMWASFPWLNYVAQNYESYRFRRLKYEFRTNTSTGAAGYLVMAIDYDAADAAPLTKQQAMSYADYARCGSWENVNLVCKPSDLNKMKSYFVRNSGMSGDIKTYDVGNLFVCVGSSGSGGIIGEVHVEYEIELMTPQLTRTLSGQYEVKNGTTTASPEIFPNPVAQGDSSISATSTGVVTVPQPGDYLVTGDMGGVGIGAWATPSVAGGATNGIFTQLTNLVNAASTAASFTGLLKVVNPNGCALQVAPNSFSGITNALCRVNKTSSSITF